MVNRTALIIVAGIALLLIATSGSGSPASPSAGSGGSTSGNDLHPNLIDAFNQSLAATNALLPAGQSVSIQSTYRTFDQQQADYNQGRDSNGNIINQSAVITYAQPGHSYHNYGLAFDFAVSGMPTPSSYAASLNSVGWMTVVNTFKAQGWQWGGDWTNFKDYDHLQYTFGFATSDLLDLYNNGDFVASPYNSNNYVNLADA
jgi:peptidoglycan L-alanyl-D-glutamate endopeptidase CwlK